MFLAVQARRKAEEKKATERVKELMDRAIKEMGSYLDDPTKERKERLYPCCVRWSRSRTSTSGSVGARSGSSTAWNWSWSRTPCKSDPP